MINEQKTHHIQGKVTPGAPSLDDVDTQIIAMRSSSVGHLAIVDGPGTGTKLPVSAGTNALGRDASKNRLVVNFGDAMIGREQHALITYDPASKAFGLQGTGHPNPIFMKGQIVTDRMRFVPGDRFIIGQTTFELIA